MITLDPLGSVTALTIVDSTCVESNGTYDLIFTGTNTTTAAGTYTILNNVITGVSLISGGSGYTAVPTVATQTGDGSVTATFLSLATAQNGQSRHPLVEIISAQKGDDIPFDGTFLTPEAFNEYSPAIIAHSSGRLCVAYCYGPDSDSDCGIKYVYTDTSRTTFSTVTIELYTESDYAITGVSVCEMSDGNIGLICLVNDGHNHVYRLLRRIVTVTGTAVSNAEIANWSHDTYTSDPWVYTIGTNSYLLVYGKKSGSDYYIYKRTSANFTTWSAEGALTIGGLTSTWRLSNPSILKISTGDIWLWFDALEATDALGAELVNVYYSVSADSGVTWANAVKVTAYDTYAEIGRHPVSIQKAVNQMHLLFTRQVGALHMDDTTTGWPTGDYTEDISIDTAKRKVYVVNVHRGAGVEYLQNVVKIDMATWAVDQFWDSTTTPGFPSFICDGTHNVGNMGRMQEGCHIAIACLDGGHRCIWLLDGEANTITNLYMDNQVAHSITQNVSHSITNGYANQIRQIHLDFSNLKLWVFIWPDYLYSYSWYVGYIDLSTIGTYAYTSTFIEDPGSIFSVDEYESTRGFYVDVAGSRIVINGGSTSVISLTGVCAVYDIESGGLLQYWQGHGTDTDFPYYGIRNPVILNDRIYAGMVSYYSGGGQSAFRGLVEIDLVTETIYYNRPSYCTEDDHVFSRPVYIGNNKLAMVHQGYGIAVFDTISKTWELFSNDNIPGMTLSGNDTWSYWTQIAYDDTNDMVYVGDPGEADGVVSFSTYGYIRQSYYSIGAYSGGAWTFGTAAQLVQGYRDYEAVAVPDPDAPTSMFCFWASEDTTGEKSIKWDKDGSSLDLSPYLVDGEEITPEHSIDGNPATLSFKVSHGHLFDPYNQTSLLSLYLKKGRKLTIRFGEKIAGTDYWQNAGTFYVVSGTIPIQRGTYPTMTIEAEDQRALWQHSHVYTTDIYSNTAAEILTDLMTDIADMALAEIDTLTIDGDQTFDHQWIETTLDEILTQVCNRVGYYYRFTVDGKFSVRKITDSAAVDHTYTNQTKIIQYSPDDKYSDFTNRVTVTGQERDFTTVTFNEERVTGVSGTIGFWGHGDKKTVWFAPDKSRRVINPRLVVVESAVGIGFKLAGSVDEELEECPSSGDYKYCIVKTTCPDLRVPLLVNITSAMALSAVPDLVLAFIAGVTIPIGRICQQIAMTMVSMILGSAVNYQYDIFGNPLGSIRRSVQGQADDEEHQAEIGCVVEQKFEDPLCYSVADCLKVAAFELMVAKMQRKRITITKVAHLQDEDGDTIRFVHPISGANIDLYVTNLKRTFKKGKDGGFFDEISGWVVNQ